MLFLDSILPNLSLLARLLLCSAILLPVTHLLTRTIYNLTLHPLSSYPGPLLSGASPLPQAWRIFSGRGAFAVHALHERYGPVVRLGPGHLSFVDARAWGDIFQVRGHGLGQGHGGHGGTAGSGSGSGPGSRGGGKGEGQGRGATGEGMRARENPKSSVYYREPLVDRAGEDPPSILDADWEEHGRLRKALAGGFSDRAIRVQEPVILGYVDLLMQKLRARAEKGEKVDVVRWFNWTTFDVVGDLVFAESFGCLESEKGHPFVDMIMGLVEQVAAFLAVKYSGLGGMWGVRWVVNKAVQLFAGDALREMNRMMGEKLRHRLEVKEERTDLFEGLVSKREEFNLDLPRLQSNATTMAAAGSETTASLLSGITFLLSQNPDAMERLKHEMRTSFSSVAEITIASVSRLPYLLACVNEALRRYPPVLADMPREVHEGGEIICGRFVPEYTIVEVQPFSMNHSSLHWHDAFAFRPERWLNKVDSTGGQATECGDKDTDGDRLEVMQAFSVGPRNCVGKNLAYAEMRLILARLVFEFDWTLADESRDWLKKSRAYSIWTKGPLYVYFTPAKRE